MTAAREIRRLRYLEALGIVPLVSRRSLPGAAPTRKLRLRAGAAAQKSEAPAAVAHPAADAAGDLRRSFADGTPQRRASARAEITEGAAAVGKPPVSPAERFSLAVFHAGPDLWIEELADPVLAREQVELVAAMARALAHPQVSDERPGVSQFDWPLHGNTQLDLGADEAASALSGFLGRQIAERPGARLICLGAAAEQRVQRLELACTRLALPSTREMLDDPPLKRRAWQALSD